jgi:hypothetical protein
MSAILIFFDFCQFDQKTMSTFQKKKLHVEIGFDRFTAQRKLAAIFGIFAIYKMINATSKLK